jgi:non-specific serine/threonine protein kinase
MGFTNGAIAHQLKVSSSTIASHVAHILSKLRFRSRAQVAAWVVGRQLRRARDSDSASTQART